MHNGIMASINRAIIRAKTFVQNWLKQPAVAYTKIIVDF